MRATLCLVVILLCASAVWAGDTVPFNVKLGLWEVTSTTSMSGMPPMPSEALAQMTPEQRARIEASMKESMSGAPRTTTEKTCETKEKLDKDLLFNTKNNDCTRTFVTSTTTRIEMKIHCSFQGQKSDGTMRFEAVTPENVKGTMDMDSSGGGQTMKVKATFTARWLGPSCGTVK